MRRRRQASELDQDFACYRKWNLTKNNRMVYYCAGHRFVLRPFRN